jgi:hypothetical protein
MTLRAPTLDEFYAMLNHSASCLYSEGGCHCSHDDAYLAYKSVLDALASAVPQSQPLIDASNPAMSEPMPYTETEATRYALREIIAAIVLDKVSELSERHMKVLNDLITRRMTAAQPSAPQEEYALGDRCATTPWSRAASQPAPRDTPVCSCDEWEPGVAKINAPIMLAQARNPQLTQTEEFRFNVFRFCPWCSKPVRTNAASRGESRS